MATREDEPPATDLDDDKESGRNRHAGKLTCLSDKKYGHAGTRTVFDKAERPTVVFELAEYRTDSYRVRKLGQHGPLFIS